MWDPQGDQRLVIHKLYSEMSLGAGAGSALLRQYFVKAQARVMSSSEIQRLSPSSMLDARLLSDSLLEVKSLELIIRVASEPMGLKPK